MAVPPPVTAPGPPPISRRSRRLLGDFVAEYMRVEQERRDTAYDPERRPDGYVSLAVAENKLMWDILGPRLTAPRDVTPRAIGYDRMTGAEPFRIALAEFLASRVFGSRGFGGAVSAEDVQVVNGAGSALELLFYAIGEPGDGVLVPTPSYAGFWLDVEGRDELTLVPVHTSADDDFALTLDRLDAALESAGRPIKALLFTSPSNPLGRVFTAEEIAAVVDWTRARGLHLVMDEIYALSVFGPRSFTSVVEVVDDIGDDIHLVWAFSKDFAMSGMRCGVVVTRNPDIHAAIESLAYWTAVPGDTQHVLRRIVEDDAFVDGYLDVMRRRLADGYAAAASGLASAGIPHLPSEAGFFTMVDLRDDLDAPTWEAEDRMWRTMVEANVNLTPGAACRVVEPGFFRLCFAAVPPDHVAEGVRRMAAAVGNVTRGRRPGWARP